uniref:Uncharacterized protein n=1 Tax=Arion vulgaris TaxID=1028688 RepID=A0A0B6ZYK1_9EUPU
MDTSSLHISCLLQTTTLITAHLKDSIPNQPSPSFKASSMSHCHHRFHSLSHLLRTMPYAISKPL